MATIAGSVYCIAWNGPGDSLVLFAYPAFGTNLPGNGSKAKQRAFQGIALFVQKPDALGQINSTWPISLHYRSKLTSTGADCMGINGRLTGSYN